MAFYCAYFLKYYAQIYTMFFSKYFFFLWDQVKVTLFFLQTQTITSYFKNVNTVLLNFKNMSFQNEYIFHWLRYSKAPAVPTLFFNKSTNLPAPNLFLTRLNAKHIPSAIFIESWLKYMREILTTIYDLLSKTFSFGFYYLRGFVFLLFIDACLTDDEPLWEPIEWSLVQTWILFIFCFAWIAENLIVSRYGSYTGRDKRVWMSWYKTFWLIEGYYVINYGVVSFFIMAPFYFETNYNLSFVYSWWHWYSRVFFFKFTAIYSVILILANLLQISIRWLNWKKGLVAILLINIFISYLIYTHFIMAFFGYFTDPIWYQKYRSVDYIQLSHEPSKWGWGSAKKDHFSYHNVKTVFWFKNDGPFAASFLFFHLFLFFCIFFLFIFWLSLLRRVWSTKELPTTLTTYCVSSLRQFFYFFLLLYAFIFLSFLTNYMRFPLEFAYFLSYRSWFGNFIFILVDYVPFLASIVKF